MPLAIMSCVEQMDCGRFESVDSIRRRDELDATQSSIDNETTMSVMLFTSLMGHEETCIYSSSIVYWRDKYSPRVSLLLDALVSMHYSTLDRQIRATCFVAGVNRDYL